MMRYFATIGLVLLPSLSKASDFHSPRTAALAGAGHASPLLNDSIYLNPSYVAFLRETVSVGANYMGYESPGGGAPGSLAPTGRSYGVALQDGRSEVFQAGVGYVTNEGGSTLNFGAAKAVVRRVGLGAGAKFYFDPERRTVATDLSLSTTAFPYKDTQAALILDNVLAKESNRGIGIYRELTLGTKLNIMGIILLYADPHWTFDHPDRVFGFDIGTELVVMSDLFLRAGFNQHSKLPYLTQAGAGGLYGNGFGFGAGWIGPRLSIDYAMARTLEPIFNTAHTFGMTVYF